MYARVTTAKIRPDKVDELIRAFEDLAPGIKGQPGFDGTQLLVDRTANKVLVTTHWKTLADLEAGAQYLQEQLSTPRVAEILAGAPTIEVYQVAAAIAATTA